MLKKFFGTKEALQAMYSRSSRSEVLIGKGVLKICSKFTGEHPIPKFDFNKVAKHIFRTSFLMNTSGWLLLVLFFLSRAPARKVLFLIRDSYMLKLCVGFSILGSVPFLLKFIFVFNKKHGLFDFKTSFLSKLK